MSDDYTLHHGDCLEELRAMPDASVDAVVTDPPYGLSNTNPRRVAETLGRWAAGDTEYVPAGRGFMGASWDSFVPPPAVWAECLRVLKPGGHLVVFAGSRTQDLMGLSVRLAGFDVRDTLGWIYGTGFPKSHDIGKAIDKAAGAEREVVGTRKKLDSYGQQAGNNVYGGGPNHDGLQAITAPATSEAKRWDGWGTALKPAIEPIILARKPLDGTVANNVLAHGVGGLNIDASRVGIDGGERDVIDNRSGAGFGTGATVGKNMGRAEGVFKSHAQGRFPANVLLDEHAAKEMDEQSGITKSTGGNATHDRAPAYSGGWDNPGSNVGGLGDTGGASRFFPVFKYQAKAPKKERPVIEHEDGTKVQHPTVKPVALMEWLVTLVTPPGGVVLDPFAGSGATLQAARSLGMHPVGVEQSADYCALIRERMD